MNQTHYFLMAVSVSAAITFSLRALPFLFFRDRKDMPNWLQKLGGVLPSAIMAVLIVYCLRSAKSDFVGSGIPSLLAVAVVALSYQWKHHPFVSIALGTAIYMILIQII